MSVPLIGMLTIDVLALRRTHADSPFDATYRVGSRKSIVHALSALAWRARVSVAERSFELDVTIVTPHPLALFGAWRERVRQRALRELSRVSPAHCWRSVRVTHSLVDTWARLRTAMLFAPPIGFGRDVAPHPMRIDADSEAATGMHRLGTIGLSARSLHTAREEQSRSFAYGNAAISNPNVTRAMIDRAAEHMAAEAWDDATPTSPRSAA